MNKIIFAVGIILTFTGAAMSYYPVFQDFDETGYEIPFHKSDDFPDFQDLLITNVHADCQYSDSVFSQFKMDGIPMCVTASNWIFSLLGMVSTGIVLMCGGAFLPRIKP